MSVLFKGVFKEGEVLTSKEITQKLQKHFCGIDFLLDEYESKRATRLISSLFEVTVTKKQNDGKRRKAYKLERIRRAGVYYIGGKVVTISQDGNTIQRNGDRAAANNSVKKPTLIQ